MEFSKKLLEIADKAEKDLAEIFKKFDDVSFHNTKKVLDSFRTHRVSDTMFYGSTGYGYNDKGRETLDEIYADVFGAESALVRHNIVNGTQAITIGLFGLLRPGDTMLSVTGKPYDTLEEVIGISGEQGNGSLIDFGVKYRQVELIDGSDFDIEEIKNALTPDTKVIFIQRSKGYMNRKTLSVEKIGKFISEIRKHTNAYIVVDNCYGEFTEKNEPTAVGADLIIGSLIKNPGGGMAETGGYLAGTRRAVELCSYRLTTVGTGAEVGATLGQNKNMYKGLFFAPHVVANALKTSAFAAYVFDALGFEVEPKWGDCRYDIIQAVKLNAPELLCAFCRGIQAGSPVDSFVTPEPWDMPGYTDKVIMAAGTFTQGASIELSADGPLRPPYTAFFQGGLTFESGKIGILSAAQEVLNELEK